MIRFGIRRRATNDAGDPARNKKGLPVHEPISDGVEIPEDALLHVRVDSQHRLESVKQSFTGLANALGARLDIAVGDEEPTHDYDPDPEAESTEDDAPIAHDYDPDPEAESTEDDAPIAHDIRKGPPADDLSGSQQAQE